MCVHCIVLFSPFVNIVIGMFIKLTRLHSFLYSVLTVLYLFTLYEHCGFKTFVGEGEIIFLLDIILTCIILSSNSEI